MQPSQEATFFPPESTHLFSFVTALESVDEHCPSHQDLCREGEGRGGGVASRESVRREGSEREVGGDKEGWIHTGAANSSRFARHTKCDEMTHPLCRGGRITVNLPMK